MKLSDVKIEDYMDKYADMTPTIGRIVGRKPRKREIKFVAHLLVNNMQHIVDDYLYQQTGADPELGTCFTFLCAEPRYDDGTTATILELSKFTKAFGIDQEDIQDAVKEEVKNGGLRLGNMDLTEAWVGPFEAGGPKGTGQSTSRLFFMNHFEHMSQLKKKREQEAEEEEMHRLLTGQAEPETETTEAE